MSTPSLPPWAEELSSIVSTWGAGMAPYLSFAPGVAGDFFQASVLLALVYLVQATPSRHAMVRLAGLALTILAAANFAIAGAAFMGCVPGAAGSFLSALLIFVGVWAVGKAVLAFHFAGLRDARYPLRRTPGHPPLPSQQPLLDELHTWVDTTHGPMCMGLDGRWGAGKSTIADSFVDRLNQAPHHQVTRPCVAVKISVWEYQGLYDLQWGVLQALYAHPASLRRLGWLQFPLWMWLFTWIKFGLVKVKVSLFGSQVNGDGELHLPWQDHLEIAVGRLVRRGIRIVLVLDEADRATPRVAQVAFTLIQRSLQLSGVLVLLPFVQPQIREKAFSPLLIESEDIKTTAFAWFRENLDDARPTTGAATFTEAVRYQCPEDAIPDSERLFREYAYYWLDHPELHNEYFRRMESKYLQIRKLVQPLGLDDLLAIARLPMVRGQFLRYFGEAGYEELRKWGEDHYGQLRDVQRLTPRTLIGEWLWLFDRAPTGLRAGECLALVIAKAQQDR